MNNKELVRILAALKILFLCATQIDLAFMLRFTHHFFPFFNLIRVHKTMLIAHKHLMRTSQYYILII